VRLFVNWSDWEIGPEQATRTITYSPSNSQETETNLHIRVGRGAGNSPIASLLGDQMPGEFKEILNKDAKTPHVFFAIEPDEGYSDKNVEIQVFLDDLESVTEKVPANMRRHNDQCVISSSDRFGNRKLLEILTEDKEFVLAFYSGDHLMLQVPLPYHPGISTALERWGCSDVLQPTASSAQPQATTHSTDETVRVANADDHGVAKPGAKADLFLEYSETAREAMDLLSSVDSGRRDLLRKHLDERGDASVIEFANELLESFEKEQHEALNPFKSKEHNAAYKKAIAISDEAGAEYISVIKLLGEDRPSDPILAKVRSKYEKKKVGPSIERITESHDDPGLQERRKHLKEMILALIGIAILITGAAKILPH
jgi:hypothetical protein